MRKNVLWCSVAVLAAVTVGALIAAYACRHPQSSVGRFVFACYDLDARYNPFHRMSDSAARHITGAVREAAGIATPASCSMSAEACVAVPPPEPRPTEVAVAGVNEDVDIRP